MFRPVKSKSLNTKQQQNDVRVVDQHLKSLHRLHTEVEQLDIIKVPHKEAPIRKQIKELIQVSAQLLKKGSRNHLGMSNKAVKSMLDMLKNQEDEVQIGGVQLKTLKRALDQTFQHKHDIQIIVKCQEICEFLTHNECQISDPTKAAFQKLDPYGEGFLNQKSMIEVMNIFGIEEMSKQTMAKLMGVSKLEDVNETVFRRFIAKFDTI